MLQFSNGPEGLSDLVLLCHATAGLNVDQHLALPKLMMALVLPSVKVGQRFSLHGFGKDVVGSRRINGGRFQSAATGLGQVVTGLPAHPEFGVAPADALQG